MSSEKAKPKKRRGFWRSLAVYFRRFRIVVWLLLLAVIASFIYLNQVGLPGMIKRPLLQRLEARGINIEFSRVRVRWYEGVVAEDVQFGSAAGNSPRVTARETKVLLNWRSLLRGRLQVDSLLVREGKMVWDIAGTNEPPRELVVDNIQTQLRLLPGDRWLLEQFQASFADADIRLSASITNASAARDWPFLKDRETPEASLVRNRLRAFADTLDRIEFPERPSIQLEVRGDARELESLSIDLAINAPEARTPWGELSRGTFQIRTHPANAGDDLEAEINLNAAMAKTKWGTARELSLAAEFTSPPGTDSETVNALHTRRSTASGRFRLTAATAATRWGSGDEISANGSWQHHLASAMPLWAEIQTSVTDARTRWATSGVAVAQIRIATTNQPSINPESDWAWWTNLHPFEVVFHTHFEQLETTQLDIAKAEVSGSWKTPVLNLHSASAELLDGHISLSASLDVDTRVAGASAALDLDLHKVDHLLTEGGRQWLAQYTWNKPPVASIDAKVVLPVWTQKEPDWRGEVLPTLWLSGQFDLAGGAGYRGIDVLSAKSRFSYSDMTWHLPDLVVTRPEGKLRAEHIANDRTRDYYWRIHSTVNPTIVRPLLDPEEARVFELLQLTSPPEIDAELWGVFHQHDRIGGNARVSVTNVTFRGQHADVIQASFAYTNKVLEVFKPWVLRGQDIMMADGLTADFNVERVYLTNAHGVADPLAVSRAIGPHVGETMEDYIFDNPIQGRAYGVIPMHGEEGADLHFDVTGGPFHWWKFNVPRISGRVHWKDETLTLSDINADFYQGKAWGKAVFDVSDAPGTAFWFTMNGTNVLLQQLVADLSTGTNRSEGWVEGSVTVTSANSADWRTVQGYGELVMHEGLLWDIPLFGVLSPILDGIMPGLGSSRATDGICTFAITNGVVHTADLDIRTPTMRLQYKGSVDLAADYAVKARVEAEPLKDVWVIGPLVSTVLTPLTKAFEYKVTGTLGEPKVEPVNIIPRIMLLPFQPLRIFKGLGTSGGSSSPPP
jgi:hypothetical protein